MDATVAQLGPWLAVTGLGAYHGLNPAMGWLFAVALGMHRHSQRVVVAALLPIAAGHASAVAAVLITFLAFGVIVDQEALRQGTGVILIGWAAWHAAFGHRRRIRIGMQTGLLGLSLWSFLMASAHGAGLMLIPVVVPLCLADSPGGTLTSSGSLAISAAALGFHTLAMLVTILAVSLVVFRWTGLAFLRGAWINADLLWSAALAASGFLLVIWTT
jgi:hypothetical protein